MLFSYSEREWKRLTSQPCQSWYKQESPGDIDNWFEVGDFCQQQRNADTSEHVSWKFHVQMRSGYLQLLLAFMRWFRQVIRHGRIRSYGRNSLKKTGQFFSSVELIYATNMARPKWHNSFYTNIAQNQEISSRVLLFSRFDFDRSFSTALNPQIISIKKLLVHKKTHHQPTSKKSHNLSNMRNHNPRMFWSYPTVYDRMNGSFPSPQLAEFHLLDPPERMTSERQLHGPKVKNVMPRPEIHLYICNHLYVFIHRYTSFIKHHLLLIG